MKQKFGIFDVIVYTVMIIVLLITVYPFIYVAAVSFSDSTYIVQNKVSFYPRGFNINAYRMILESPTIPRAYMNTIIYTAAGVFFNMLFTITMAYPLSKKYLKGKGFVTTLVVITMFFNGGIIPNYLVVRNFHLLDSMWALIIPNAIWTFELLILKSFFESMPEEIYEAARIDGASEFRVLLNIAIPLSKAAIASVSLFYAMGHWNSFFLPMIYISSMNKLPLQVVLRDMLMQDTLKTSSTIGDYSSLTPMAVKNATIFISLIPMLLLYPFIQRFFTKGLMLGAVKG